MQGTGVERGRRRGEGKTGARKKLVEKKHFNHLDMVT